MDPLPIKLGGRVMEPEKIILSRGAYLTDSKCDWTRNLMSDVLVPVKIDSWILVYTERDLAKAKDFRDCVAEVSPKMGIKVAPPKMIGLPNDRTDTYVNRIREEINSTVKRCHLVVLFWR